jgi:hypothetical protein
MFSSGASSSSSSSSSSPERTTMSRPPSTGIRHWRSIARLAIAVVFSGRRRLLRTCRTRRFVTSCTRSATVNRTSATIVAAGVWRGVHIITRFFLPLHKRTSKKLLVWRLCHLVQKLVHGMASGQLGRVRKGGSRKFFHRNFCNATNGIVRGG